MLASLVAACALLASPALASSGGGLVQITAPAGGAVLGAARVPVTVRLAAPAVPSSLRVLLDFRDVTSRFTRHGRTYEATLTAADGLLSGANVVTASVSGPGGARSAAQVIFRVTAGGLLAGQAGAPPTFSLQTRVVTYSPAEPGDHFAVKVGDTTHPAPAAPAWACGTGAWVLALNRQSLDVASSEDYPLCSDRDVTALGAVLSHIPAADLVIVNTLYHGGSAPPIKGLGSRALARIGAIGPEFDPLSLGYEAFSVEGIAGLPAGQAYQVGVTLDAEDVAEAGLPSPASINATLAVDNNGNYSPVMRDDVAFDLRPDGSITAGGQTYPVPQLPGGLTGGFHVVVLDRRTLGVISDRVYATAGDSGYDLAGQLAMADDLTKLAADSGESVLVLVDAVGDPMHYGQAPVAGPTLAQALAPFGATPDVVDGNPYANPRYALVGAVSPPPGYGQPRFGAPETSATIHAGATGELTGVLQRGTRGMWYGPAAWNASYVADVDGVKQPPTTVNYALYSLLAQVPVPWPVPAASGPGHAGQQAAYQYLSNYACTGCGNDIRAYYSSETETIQTWLTAIRAATYPDGSTLFTQAQFDAVQSQLVTELGDIYLVDGLREDMHNLLSDTNQLLQPALTAAYQDVRSTIKADNGARVISVIYQIVQTVAALAAPVEELGPALGVAAALLADATALADDPDGAPLNQLQTTVASLGQQAAAGFAAGLTGLDQTFGAIFSDWGRLAAVADGLKNHPADWDIAGKEGKVVTAMTNAMKISYYAALIPLVYETDEAQNLHSSDPAQWCSDGAYDSGCPFAPPDGYALGTSAYTYLVHDPTHGWENRYHMIVVGQIPITGIYQDRVYGNVPFPSALMSDLTAAGEYPGWFFDRFPFTRLVCAPSKDPDDCVEQSG
ncbi:MAG: hypothetical protein ACRDOH_20410 [Streptosporangiaceae bacterium]